MGWRSFLSQVLRLAPLFSSRFTIWTGRSGERGQATTPTLRAPAKPRPREGDPPRPAPSHLEVAAVHGVVQRGAARAVRDVDSAEQGDDGLHALGGPVGSGDVQRRLPILVAGIDVCRVLQEEVKCLLEGAEESRAPARPAAALHARSQAGEAAATSCFQHTRGCPDPQPPAPGPPLRSIPRSQEGLLPALPNDGTRLLPQRRRDFEARVPQDVLTQKG